MAFTGGALGFVDRLREFAERAPDAGMKIRYMTLADGIEAFVQQCDDELEGDPTALDLLDKINAIADRDSMTTIEKCGALAEPLAAWLRDHRTN